MLARVALGRLPALPHPHLPLVLLSARQTPEDSQRGHSDALFCGGLRRAVRGCEAVCRARSRSAGDLSFLPLPLPPVELSRPPSPSSPPGVPSPPSVYTVRYR